MSEDTLKNAASADADGANHDRSAHSGSPDTVCAEDARKTIDLTENRDSKTTNPELETSRARADNYTEATATMKGVTVPNAPKDLFDILDDIEDDIENDETEDASEISIAEVLPQAQESVTDSLTPEVEQHLKEFFQIGQDSNGASPPFPPRTLLTNELVDSFDFGTILNDGVSQRPGTTASWTDELASAYVPRSSEAPESSASGATKSKTVPDPEFGNIDIHAEDAPEDVPEEKTTPSLSQDVLDAALNIAQSRGAVDENSEFASDIAANEATTAASANIQEPTAPKDREAGDTVAAANATTTITTADTVTSSLLDDELAAADRPTIPSKRAVEVALLTTASKEKKVSEARKTDNPQGADGANIEKSATPPQQPGRTASMKIVGFVVAAAALFAIGFLIFRNDAPLSPDAPGIKQKQGPLVSSQTSAVTVAENRADLTPAAARASDADVTFFDEAPSASSADVDLSKNEESVSMRQALLVESEKPLSRASAYFEGDAPPSSTPETAEAAATSLQAPTAPAADIFPDFEVTPSDLEEMGSEHPGVATAAEQSTGESKSDASSEKDTVDLDASPVETTTETDDVVFTASFKTGTAIFSFPSKAAESAFVREVRKRSDGKKILIRGYVTQSEKDMRLGKIAISRAWAVQKFLQRRKFDPAMMQSMRGYMKLRENLPTERNAVVTVSFIDPMLETVKPQSEISKH